MNNINKLTLCRKHAPMLRHDDETIIFENKSSPSNGSVSETVLISHSKLQSQKRALPWLRISAKLICEHDASSERAMFLYGELFDREDLDEGLVDIIEAPLVTQNDDSDSYLLIERPEGLSEETAP